MKRSLSRTLYLIALGIAVVGTILLFVSLVGSTPSTATSQGSIGNPVLFGISLFLMFASAIPAVVAWIGALVKMAQLSRWGWFVCLIFFSGITMLIYIFAGPETPAASQVAGAPYGQPYPLQPQQPYGQPQQPQQPYGQPPYPQSQQPDGQPQYQQPSYDQPQQSYGQYPEQPPPNRG